MTDRRSSEPSPRPPDPFEIWRQFYEATEQTWGKALQEAMSSQAFAEASGKMLETFLAFQKMLRDSATAQLAAFNLPTRDDVARLGELLVGLEEKVDQLHDRLAALEARLERPAGPAERKRRALDEPPAAEA
jgi:polyhydroxyalkanoic acid synthase PhaR subunit